MILKSECFGILFSSFWPSGSKRSSVIICNNRLWRKKLILIAYFNSCQLVSRHLFVAAVLIKCWKSRVRTEIRSSQAVSEIVNCRLFVAAVLIGCWESRVPLPCFWLVPKINARPFIDSYLTLHYITLHTRWHSVYQLLRSWVDTKMKEISL